MTMKSLLMIPAMLLFLGTASAQDKTAPPTKPAKTEKAEAKPAKAEMMKEHACTAACKDGKHMYAHGEKGHACSEECKKMHAGTKGHEGHEHGEMKEHSGEMHEHKGEMKEKGEMGTKGDMHGNGEMKAHVCTSACVDGKHAYAHGEKGHTCDANCKHMREQKK